MRPAGTHGTISDVSASPFRIGLVQMSCSPDPEENLAKALGRIREAAGRGAQIVCLQELFRSQYFCREENAELFDLAEPIPGPSTRELFGSLPRELNVVIVGVAVRAARRRACITTPRAVIDADGTLLGPLPQDAHPRRSALLREVLLHARRSRLPLLRHALRPHRARWSAGTSGIPEAARLAALGGAQILFYPDRDRLASRRRRRSTARRSTMPGEPSSARTPSPTASTWRR